MKTFFFFVPVFDSYPCRTVVRKHFVPRHFFSGSPQKNCFCGVIVWTRCVVVNKFTHNATSRGSVLSLQKPNGCKKRSFFCACLETCTPAAQSCGGTLCLDTSSRGPRKRIAFVGCGRLTLQINLPSALFHEVPVPNRIKKLRCGARRALDDPNRLI